MKGVNLKKIGAIVAGVTILASSVAFAGLFYQNTELVDANGQPVAKVVLGSGAAASDGAVAGAIAAKLASAAYKKQTVTASVAADATCSTGATGGNGTCAISNEKVTLEVTVPGTTNSGVHEFATLIGDYIDRELGNRDNVGTDDLYGITAASETDPDANPFDDELGVAGLPTDESLYRINGDNFGAFASKTITDPSSGDTYTEMQSTWIDGSSSFVSGDNAIESNLNMLVYQAKFDEGTHTGIPKCTTGNSTTDFAYCGHTDSDYTGKHRVKISFLGSDWIITSLEPDTTSSIDNSDMVASDGGTVKLAKESVYGIVNVGDSLSSKDGQLKVRLDDISTPVTAGQIAPAIVSFLDANGNVLKQDQINPGDTQKETIGGVTYKVLVYQTAPGYTFGAKWAEMALLENELELKDGEVLDTDLNNDWNVELLWKNRQGDATYDNPDALRSIILYKNGFGDSLLAGDSVNVVEDPVAYKLTYLGLDLTGSDYDNLKFTAKGPAVTLNMPVSGETCTLAQDEYVKVTTGVTDGFRGTDGGSDVGKGDTLYYMLDTVTGTGVSDCGGALAGTLDPGDVIMKKSGSTSNKYVILDNAGGFDDYEYKTVGSAGTAADGGVLEIDSSTADAPLFSIIEDVGKVDTDDHAVASLDFVYATTAVGFESALGDNDKVTFGFTVDEMPDIFGYTAVSDYDEGKFISPRGSKFTDMTATSATFKPAKKVGHALYQYATVAAANQSGSTTQLTLSEGQTGTVGDVTILVKSIDETVGACTATGSAATCTVPKDTINAVIMPDNTASKDVVVPYAVNPKLVILDSDAAAVSTGVLITVGGDKVNTVTADAMSGAGIDFTATPSVVKVVGNKIIVAGLTAQDTVAAGDAFLAAVQSQ